MSAGPQRPVWPRKVLVPSSTWAGSRVKLGVSRKPPGVLSRPAGECPGGLADVAFRVIPGAQGEQLEELAGEVLVGLILLAGSSVEPDEHGRVGDDRLPEARRSCRGREFAASRSGGP